MNGVLFPSVAHVVDGRSPFVRLAELIADIKPGKPAIDLGVGEPKHACRPSWRR